MAGYHPAYADMPEDSVITNGFLMYYPGFAVMALSAACGGLSKSA